MASLFKQATVCIVALSFFAACQKNTAQTSQRNLTIEEKSALFSRVAADTIFKQWNTNQLKVVEAYAQATRHPDFNIQKLQSYKPKNDQELIAALKEAGAPNADEILALNKRSMQLLKELWQKFPDLDKLSQDELTGLKIKIPLKP